MGCKSNLEMLSHIAGNRDYLVLMSGWYYCATPSIKGAVRRDAGLSIRDCDLWGTRGKTTSEFEFSLLHRKSESRFCICLSLPSRVVSRFSEHLVAALGIGVRSKQSATKRLVGSKNHVSLWVTFIPLAARNNGWRVGLRSHGNCYT